VFDYYLFMNDGLDGAVFTQITNYVYSTHGFTSTLTIATEGMTAGRFYQFKYQAENSVGTSD